MGWYKRDGEVELVGVREEDGWKRRQRISWGMMIRERLP